MIVRKIKRATDFEIVLFNLAIADLINSFLFVAVAVIAHHSKHGRELKYDTTLFSIIGITSFALTASVSFVAVIGIERFLAVKLPLQHRLWHTNRRRLVKYILLTWLFDVILVASLSIAEYLQEHKIPDSISAKGAYYAAGTLTFGSVIILVMYTWVLYLMIVRSLKPFHFDCKTMRINKYMIKEAMKKEKSSIGTCILVVVSFMACNLPLIVDLF